MIFKSFFSQEMLGLDLQPEAIQAVRLKKYGRRYQVNALYRKDMPKNVFYQGVITDWSLLQLTLDEFVQEHQLSDLPVVMGLAECMIKRQRLQLLPMLAEDDISREVYAAFKQDPSHVPPSLVVDFIATPDKEFLDVMAVAVPKTYVDQLVALMQACHLRIKIIDLERDALERILRFINMPDVSMQENAVLPVRALFSHFYFACEWKSLPDITPFLCALGFAIRDAPGW